MYMNQLFTMFFTAFTVQIFAQNVGIGLGIPTARLHIGGDVKIKQNNQQEFRAGIVGKEINAELQNHPIWR
jgi:hypothetical protein